MLTRVVKGMIPDRISYPHFFPIFCLDLRKRGMENPRKSHPFYKPEVDIVFDAENGAEMKFNSKFSF